MGATYGTSLDTKMSTITFDSTGRAVQFTVEESGDFETFLRGIKMQGKICKESIAHDALVELQKLGKAIEGGDPNTIADLWLFHAKRVLDKAVLNNMIPKEETLNPFALYFINDSPFDDEYDVEKVKTALNVSKVVKDYLDELAGMLIAYDGPKSLEELMTPTAAAIRVFYDSDVGLSDTASRDSVIEYLDKFLAEKLHEKYREDIRQELCNLL